MAKSLAAKALDFSTQQKSMDIIEFTESPRGLNIKLLPQQKFFLKIFKKMELEDTEVTIELKDKFNEKVLQNLTEVEFYDYLLDEGKISLTYEEYLKSNVIQFILNWGRRASKSTIVSVFVAYELYLLLLHEHPQKYFGILDNDPMYITIAALGQDNADRIFGKFYGIVKSSPFFKPYIREEATGNELKVWSRHDLGSVKKVSKGKHSNTIFVQSVPNSPGVRGDSNLFVVLDEYAHFNNNAKSTADDPLDKRIYKALVPSMSGFTNPDGSAYGRALILSSANGEKGNFYEELTKAFQMGGDSGSLACSMATWEVNGTVSSEFLKSEYKKDPQGFDQEYGSKFGKSGENWLQDHFSYYLNIDTSLPKGGFSHGMLGKDYFLGVDFALSNDGTSVAVSHHESAMKRDIEYLCDNCLIHWNGTTQELQDIINEASLGLYVVDYTEVRYAGKAPYEDDTVLLIDNVMDWIEEVYARYPIRYGIFDQWSGEIIKQHLDGRGIKHLDMVQHTEKINHSQYVNFSELIHSHKLKLPDDETLHKEILNLQVERRAKGAIKVEAPQGSRYHDDRFDGLIRSLYLCHAYHNNIKTLGTFSLDNMYYKHSAGNHPMKIKNYGSYKAYKELKKRTHGTNVRNSGR